MNLTIVTIDPVPCIRVCSSGRSSPRSPIQSTGGEVDNGGGGELQGLN